MNFDLVAPFYLPLERLFAGRRMQECRTAFLNQIPAPRHVLLCGEGTGSFLLELRNRFPHTRITLVDSLRCVKLVLWDEKAGKLLSFRDVANASGG